jgi:hypothetical protein
MSAAHLTGAAEAEPTLPMEKLETTLRAELALAGGYLLHTLADGSYLVSRWNMTRPCADLREVRAFLDRVRPR